MDNNRCLHLVQNSYRIHLQLKTMLTLSDKEVEENLSKLSENWKCERKKLLCEFTFTNYNSTIDFANKVAQLAIKQNHHPSIQIDYGEVKITITTHDVGNQLTQKDFELAIAIEKIY